MSDESVTRKPLWFLIVIISTQVILIFSLLSQERVLDSYTQELELMKRHIYKIIFALILVVKKIKRLKN